MCCQRERRKVKKLRLRFPGGGNIDIIRTVSSDSKSHAQQHGGHTDSCHHLEWRTANWAPIRTLNQLQLGTSSLSNKGCIKNTEFLQDRHCPWCCPSRSREGVSNYCHGPPSKLWEMGKQKNIIIYMCVCVWCYPSIIREGVSNYYHSPENYKRDKTGIIIIIYTILS